MWSNWTSQYRLWRILIFCQMLSQGTGVVTVSYMAVLTCGSCFFLSWSLPVLQLWRDMTATSWILPIPCAFSKSCWILLEQITASTKKGTVRVAGACSFTVAPLARWQFWHLAFSSLVRAATPFQSFACLWVRYLIVLMVSVKWQFDSSRVCSWQARVNLPAIMGTLEDW